VHREQGFLEHAVTVWMLLLKSSKASRRRMEGDEQGVNRKKEQRRLQIKKSKGTLTLETSSFILLM